MVCFVFLCSYNVFFPDAVKHRVATTPDNVPGGLFFLNIGVL